MPHRSSGDLRGSLCSLDLLYLDFFDLFFWRVTSRLLQALEFFRQKPRQLLDIGNRGSARDQAKVQIVEITLNGDVEHAAIRWNRDRKIMDHLRARAIQRFSWSGHV